MLQRISMNSAQATYPSALTRTAFREAVFTRDRHHCVVCQHPAIDAHHLLERRLWNDGGYHLANGVSLCAEHHLEAEMTTLSVEDLRCAAGITQVLVPDQLEASECYDKWGNPKLANGQRLRGPLFEDESVQKILSAGAVLHLFTHWVKYPRTMHMPWSESVSDDDRTLRSVDGFIGRRVIVTEKPDGENTTFYRNKIHARSLESKAHPSRT
jgi:hypothetical protein